MGRDDGWSWVRVNILSLPYRLAALQQKQISRDKIKGSNYIKWKRRQLAIFWVKDDKKKRPFILMQVTAKGDLGLVLGSGIVFGLGLRLRLELGLCLGSGLIEKVSRGE